MKIIQTFLGKIATICSGERRELLEDEENIKSGNNLPELLPGQVRLFNPLGIQVKPTSEIKTQRIIGEIKEKSRLNPDTEMQE